MPPRNIQGAVPLLGRLDEGNVYSTPSDPTHSGGTTGDIDPCSTWLFVGLGARGLLYHALFAQQLAAAVLHGDEQRLEPDVRAWKQGRSLAAQTTD